jgi:argininosuccinate lyase
MGYSIMSNKIWQTKFSETLNPIVESYTKNKDQRYDQKLLHYDIRASEAHAYMLNTLGIISKEELTQLNNVFEKLHSKWEDGKFLIQPHHEDGHSAIEEYLIEQLGDTGKKIHTGRSRNDQTLVVMRLYMLEELDYALKATKEIIKELKKKTAQSGSVPMPGYTHMQKAMPTTVGMWLGSYSDALEDTQLLMKNAIEILNQNPLGSAAGFGSSLQINRKITSRSLGFSKTQENPMYCGLSRGLFELVTVQSINPTIALIGKFAQDMLLFTTEEFGFFSLPASFTTGSSIMPQKKNYDVFEVMRGFSHEFYGYISQIQSIYCSIGSGYQRDLQLSKYALIETMESSKNTMHVFKLIIPEIRVHEDKLRSAITQDMKSIDIINALVSEGTPFRDAYRKVKDSLLLD